MHDLFVGRAAELAELDRRLELAARGHGQVVLLTGPAGIGKTALIQRCLSAWAGRADAVLASGDAQEAAMAGGLLSQLVQAGAAAAGQMAVLAPGGCADALTAGSALLAFLRERSSGGPLILVIDDAQWGDELSLKALSFAVRRLQADPVLGLMAIRPEGLPRLPPGITRLVDDYGARVELGGLADDEVGAMAELAGRGRLPGRAAQRLREHTAGVPLHIRELLHDVPNDTLMVPGVTLPVPRSLETLVLSRLAACAFDTERFVVAAAVLGTECELADAAALAGLADPLPALQEAIQQRLLEERETLDSRRCVFPRAAIRTAVYRDIGVSRRAALHAAAARLTTGGTGLAHRVASCPGADPELAAELAAQAACERSAGQLAEAADHLLMAVRVGHRGEDTERWLLEALELLIGLGDVARARSYAADVTTLPPSARRSLLLGRLAIFTGECMQARRWVDNAWAMLRPETSPAHIGDSAAQAACELAQMLTGQNLLDDAAAWARRAEGTAISASTRAGAAAALGASLAAAGETGQAMALLAAELRQCADDSGRALLRISLGATLLNADDLPGAAGHLDPAIQPGDRASVPMAHLLEARLLRVLVGYRSGSWDQAAAEGERLVTLIDDLDQGWLLPRAHLIATHVAAGRGQWLAATGHTEAASRQTGGGAGAIELAAARAAIAVARDDPEGMLAAAEDVISDLRLLSRLEPTRLSFWPAYAEALARTGKPDEADGTLRTFEELSRSHGRRSAMAAASRARGIVQAIRNRPEDALSAFDASLDHLDGLGMPLAEAMTRLERGRVLRRLGRRRSATRELGAARALFAGLGAQPFLARCDSELCADLPAVPGAAQPPLTARQLSVAQAAAAGKSNRQIAADLYISVKTVEFHLGQILARLDLDSRTQIADALVGWRATKDQQLADGGVLVGSSSHATHHLPVRSPSP